MALNYNGATAGSTLANPLVQLVGPVGGPFQYGTTAATSTGQWSGKLWIHASSSLISEFTALNAVNDGLQLGVKPGDVLICITGTAGSTSPIVGLGVFAFPATANTTGICLSSNVLTSTAV